MENNSVSNSNAGKGGLGFCAVLTIVFIVLKLTKVIDWQWVWVLSPLWISTGLVLFIVVIILILTIIRR